MTTRSRPVLLALAIACAAARPGAGQQHVTTVDAKVMIYSVLREQTTRFDDLLVRILHQLKEPDGSGAAVPALSLKVFRSQAPPAEAGTVPYVVIVERAPAGTDYSLEALAGLVLPEQAGAISRELRLATGNVPPSIQNLALVDAITPTDQLRGRLNSYLASQLAEPDQTSAGVADDGTDARLDQIRAAVWTIDALTYRVAGRNAFDWVFQWTCSLRNTSLSVNLAADVAIEFRDAGGAILATDRVFEAVPVQQVRTFTGELRLPAAQAVRVAAATAAVAPR
ncbi:MAG: hypothetical protein IT176_04555 [Acidobacteria bacterium]|nr:hypothetical protein [Acidobacteriota bacterium]